MIDAVINENKELTFVYDNDDFSNVSSVFLGPDGACHIGFVDGRLQSLEKRLPFEVDIDAGCCFARIHGCTFKDVVLVPLRALN